MENNNYEKPYFDIEIEGKPQNKQKKILPLIIVSAVVVSVIVAGVIIGIIVKQVKRSNSINKEKETVTELILSEEYIARVGWIDTIERQGENYEYLYMYSDIVPGPQIFRGTLTTDTSFYYADFYGNYLKEITFSEIQSLCNGYKYSWDNYYEYPDSIILEMEIAYEYDKNVNKNGEWNDIGNKVISITIRPERDGDNETFINKYIN